MSAPDFGSDFAWGAASSPYQIEGGGTGGRGESVWDEFCRQPGRVFGGHDGAVACEHLTRYKEDVAIYREAGWNAYRFGVSWPRVMPGGTGEVNAEGLDFYDRLVDELLAADIRPWVTLFHWDYPLALYQRGGWLNRDSAAWMADYAAVVVGRLSDRVRHWFTMNEPQCFIGLGHFRGVHAPGDKLGLRQVLQAAHNTLRAHGETVRAIRANSLLPATVGWAPSGVVAMPASESAEDIAAAESACFDMSAGNPLGRNEPNPLWVNSWWSDPVHLGRYPEDGWLRFGDAVPEIEPGDMETISQPVDFYGAIIYTGSIVRAGADGAPEVVPLPAGFPASSLGWPVLPESLYWGPEFLYRRYKSPIVIAENGVAWNDWVALDGSVPDAMRCDFLRRYLGALARWKSGGGDVRGYFHWAAMDNFEWHEGYKDRFGLVHVDFATGRRTLKSSAFVFRDIIREEGRSLFASPG
jgi:beta-glucosidase